MYFTYENTQIQNIRTTYRYEFFLITDKSLDSGFLKLTLKEREIRFGKLV